MTFLIALCLLAFAVLLAVVLDVVSVSRHHTQVTFIALKNSDGTVSTFQHLNGTVSICDTSRLTEKKKEEIMQAFEREYHGY